MSDFKFRFGTYGSENVLYADVRTETDRVGTDYSLVNAVVGEVMVTNPEHVKNLEGTTATSLIQSSDSKYVFEKEGSITYNPPKIIYTCTGGFKPDILQVTNPDTGLTEYCDKVNISYDFIVKIKNRRTFKISVGTIYLKVYFVNNESGKEESMVVSSNWHANAEELVGTETPSGKGTLNVEIDNSEYYTEGNTKTRYLNENTLSRIEILYTSGTLDEITISNFKVTGIRGGNIIMRPKTVKVKDKDGKEVDAYLCPWELKHVESISVTISGQTSTMGIPNKPASRTQIFDTGGAVRTIKVSGKRYDNEEAVSNWDFIYNQFNVAKDSEYKGKDEYTYIGISWLLSTIQVLLKGYTFNIRSSGMDDFRYPFKTNPKLEDCIVANSITELPVDPEGDIYNGLFGYTKDTKKYYRGAGSGWVEYHPIEDTGYNVALTGFNSTFSESQPGLLEYSLTLTERFKNGNNIYSPYDPLTEEEK